jgi:dTDP-4-amino-4,6-dideoxygalactose transaminase
MNKIYKPKKFIPYGSQSIYKDDINSVVKVLKSDFLTQGEAVPFFESKISKYVGAKYAIATNSGTSALHIACLALGLQNGDYLWTSPISFVASANCGLYCGAKIDFVDINQKTWNIDTNCLIRKLDKAKK